MALLTGGVNLLSAAMPLITIVLAKELGASDAQIGLIFSIGGIGGIVGSLVGGRIQRRFTFGQVIIGCIWLWTLAFAAMMVTPSWFLVGVLSALMSFFGPIYNVVQFSYRVALIPDALQGRVNSTFRMLAFGFMPIGAVLAGWLIEAFGVVSAIGAFVAILALLALATSVNAHVRRAGPIEHAAPG
jgi:predicted MFS family arabinose efflux permease